MEGRSEGIRERRPNFAHLGDEVHEAYEASLDALFLGCCCGGANKLLKARLDGVRDRLVLLGFGECGQHAGYGLKRCRTTRAGVKMRLDYGAVGGGEGTVEQVVRVCSGGLAAARGTARGSGSVRENLHES